MKNNVKSVKSVSSNKKAQVYSKSTSYNDFVMLPNGTLVPAKEYKEAMKNRW